MKMVAYALFGQKFGSFLYLFSSRGTSLLEELHLCPSLEWVCLGDATKFKQCQNEAVAKLRADCPHLIVDCT
jgi:hypothetical protein